MGEREEELPFTEEHIGSEILERFSSDIYNPTAIIRELVKNAYDSYFQLEEHLDNIGADLETEPLVEVNLHSNNNTVIIQDKGLGLDKHDFNLLISIALTEKREIHGASGFRGIGFWSAFTAGDEIQVNSTKYGADRGYRLILNTRLMRELQKPNTSIGSIMNNSSCKRFLSYSATKTDHYTQVLLRSESEGGRLRQYIHSDELMKEALIKGCSAMVADESPYCNEISSFYRDNNIRPLKLVFMGNEIKRRIPDNVSLPRVESFEVETKGNKQAVARVIYCSSKTTGNVSGPVRGIQIFRDGFPIGNPNLYSEKKLVGSKIEIVSQNLLNWHVGEVHLLHDELRPDASGENIRSSYLMDVFTEQLRYFYQRLTQESRAKDHIRRTKKEYDDFRDSIGTISNKLRENETLTPDDLTDIEKMRKVIDSHVNATKGRTKPSEPVSNKKVYLRDEELKKQRRSLNTQLGEIEKQADLKKTKGSCEETSHSSEPEDSHDDDAEKAKGGSKSGQSSGSDSADQQNNVVPVTTILAVLDEVRDLVIHLLKDEEEIREELLAGINSGIERIHSRILT